MSRLVIKFPTRNRPEKFKSIFTRYCLFLGGRHEVRFVVSMDEDDATMNNDSMREWLQTRQRNIDLKFCYGHSKTKIEACNADLEGETGDVLMLASDDMHPVTMGYDDIIMEGFRQGFPDFDGALKFWDGLRAKDDPVMTLPILGFPLYRRFGYIYHPSYLSLFCDNEQSAVCIALDRLKCSDMCIIEHKWTPEPFDELHARNESSEMYRADKITFQTRKSINFDLETLLNACSS